MKKWVFVLGLLTAFQANAACDVEGYFDCGDTGDVKWYLSSDKKTLSISGTGAMGGYGQEKVYENGVEQHSFTTAPWRDYTFDVENIVVEKGVTGLGDYSFVGFENVQNVSLPDTLETIGNRAFKDLKKLSDIDLPNSLTIIGDGAFLGCEGLTDIVVPNSVTTVGQQAFYNARGLQSVVIPASVTSIGAKAFGAGADRLIAGNVYCEEVSGEISPCAEVSGLPQERLKYYTKDDKGVINFNGQKYPSLERLAKQIPVRRIYTVNEANQAAGKKNSVMIKYK